MRQIQTFPNKNKDLQEVVSSLVAMYFLKRYQQVRAEKRALST